MNHETLVMYTQPHDIAAVDTTTVLQAARAGDKTAWEELVHRYDGAVRATVASYRLAPADAADVAQNTWLRLVEHAASIRDPEKLGGMADDNDSTRMPRDDPSSTDRASSRP